MPTLALEPGVNVSTAKTLAELFTTQTEEQIREQLLASLRTAEFPITDWYAGSVGRTLVELVSEALVSAIAGDPAQSNGLIEQIASAGYVDFAELLDSDAIQRRWLTLLAKQMYRLDRFAATRTTGTVTLSAALGAGPVSVSNRQLVIEAASGNRYVGPTEVGPIVIPDGGSVTATFESEFPNDSKANPPLNYVDASGSIIGLVTVIPGVTVSNPAPDFSPVTQSGVGTGTITPSRTVPATPPTAAILSILITGDGDVGVGTWSLSVDGGPFVAQGTIPTSFPVPGKGITLTFANVLTPSFRVGDRYNVSSPGSWVLSQGTDEETNQALASRCRSRWPDLSDVPTSNVYDLWARQATNQVTQVKVFADAIVAGVVNVIVAGQAGSLPAAVIAVIQSYIDIRQPITDKAIVASATPTGITLAGTVTAAASGIAVTQAQVQNNVQTYINSVGIGGTIRLAGIIEAIMIADGAIDVSGLTINGGGNLTLGATSIASFTQVLATSLTWVSG